MKKKIEIEILERIELLEIENKMLLSRLSVTNKELDKKRTIWHKRPSEWDWVRNSPFHELSNPRFVELSKKHRSFVPNFNHQFQ